MRIDPLRYFLTVGLHSTYLLGVMIAVAVSGVALLVSDPSKGAEAIAPLALVQMFAASTGFTVPARRGHYDLLFTGGSRRHSIALTHFAVSVAPGTLLWLALGVAEMAAAHTAAPTSFAFGTIVLFMLVSGPVWALTAGLPRLSGAIGWLLVMALWRAAGLGDRSVVGTLLCPFVLIGERLTSGVTNAAAAAIVMSVLLPMAAIAWIVRMDVPLESAQ